MTPVAPSLRRFVGHLPVVLALGCGSGAHGYSLDVGTDDGGTSLVLGAGDANVAGAFDAHIEQNHITVTFVTLSCTGPCADVVAVPTGGQAPYTFKWDDGSTSATKEVCPTSSTHYSVKVADSGATGELASAPQTVQVSLAANVIACPDGGSSDAGGDAQVPLSITVPGVSDIWLAGQPDGSFLPDTTNGGKDVAPTNSPVEVNVTAGRTLTFSATGSTSYTGGICNGPSPDGGCIITINSGPGDGLSASQGIPADALIGVFVGPGAPTAEA